MSKENIYSNFDDNPLKLLWVTKSRLMEKYLWIILVIIIVFLISGKFLGFVNFSKWQIDSLLDTSISGLSFTMIIISASVEIFNNEELVILIKATANNKPNGYAFLWVLAPYAFSAVLFLLLGIISIITPIIELDILQSFRDWFIIAYISLVVLSLLSLFNISYKTLNDLYYSIIRMSRKSDNTDSYR